MKAVDLSPLWWECFLRNPTVTGKFQDGQHHANNGAGNSQKYSPSSCTYPVWSIVVRLLCTRKVTAPLRISFSKASEDPWPHHLLYLIWYRNRKLTGKWEKLSIKAAATGCHWFTTWTCLIPHFNSRKKPSLFSRIFQDIFLSCMLLMNTADFKTFSLWILWH